MEVTLGAAEGRALAFHGTLYNRKTLLQKLDLAGDAATDQLLLRAWTRWPDDCTERLDRSYALAHWDEASHHLTLRRDPSGALGLFYARTASGGLAFSTHLGTLVRLPGLTARIGREGLHEYLRMLDIAPPNTIYDGVRAVPPGEGLILDSLHPGRETVLPPRTAPPVAVSFDEAVAELETRLAASIARRSTPRESRLGTSKSFTWNVSGGSPRKVIRLTSVSPMPLA